MARAAIPDGAPALPEAAGGLAPGSSKKGISSEKPDIVPECSDSAPKDQKCRRFVLFSEHGLALSARACKESLSMEGTLRRPRHYP
jgi:hypothetical protein